MYLVTLTSGFGSSVPLRLKMLYLNSSLFWTVYEVVPPQLLSDAADDSSDAQDNPLGLQIVTDFGVVNDTIESE